MSLAVARLVCNLLAPATRLLSLLAPNASCYGAAVFTPEGRNGNSLSFGGVNDPPLETEFRKTRSHSPPLLRLVMPQAQCLQIAHNSAGSQLRRYNSDGKLNDSERRFAKRFGQHLQLEPNEIAVEFKTLIPDKYRPRVRRTVSHSRPAVPSHDLNSVSFLVEGMQSDAALAGTLSALIPIDQLLPRRPRTQESSTDINSPQSRTGQP